MYMNPLPSRGRDRVACSDLVSLLLWTTGNTLKPEICSFLSTGTHLNLKKNPHLIIFSVSHMFDCGFPEKQNIGLLAYVTKPAGKLAF